MFQRYLHHGTRAIAELCRFLASHLFGEFRAAQTNPLSFALFIPATEEGDVATGGFTAIDPCFTEAFAHNDRPILAGFCGFRDRY